MKILLVEDDFQVCSFINKGLTENGFEVSVAMTGDTGLQIAKQSNFDLIILDIMLPDMSGLDVCQQVRKINSQIPILFLTALGSAENIVLGLETGADDYLVKPFKFIELIARVKTLLRRADNHGLPKANEELYVFSDIEINDQSKIVKRNGQNISLTSTEYRLLLMFMKNATKVLSRTSILDEVWGITFDMGTNVVDVYVNYLRKKLDKYGTAKLIHTVIGMGYVLKESNENS
ncbi:response regulator transcription factor [Reichenbachiella sp. MALMAid0571]|uniref:response regulator transcription factor n=1 Tax=Reichenbachiella sp. MALMAid0571 TaxID=3143939 RepID=UPI0032E02347